MTTLHYFKANKYGNNHYYLAETEAQIKWQRLTGRKTITKEDMKILKKWLQVEFQEVLAPEQPSQN